MEYPHLYRPTFTSNPPRNHHTSSHITPPPTQYPRTLLQDMPDSRPTQDNDPMNMASFPLTPPDSEETKPLDSFASLAQYHSKEDPELFSQESYHPAPRARLFGEGKSSLPGFEGCDAFNLDVQATIKRFSQASSPSRRFNESDGKPLPAYVKTWEDVSKWAKAKGAENFTRPTRQEYGMMSDFCTRLNDKYIKFDKDMQHSAQESLEFNQTMSRKQNRPRKLLQDGGAERRRQTVEIAPHSQKVPSMSAGAAHSPSPTSTGRRRSSKLSAKGMETEARHVRGKSIKAQKPKNYLEYPDYSPSFLHASDAMTHAHKAHAFDQKKGRKDLTQDDKIHELDPSEVVVASYLQLDCQRYLTSKRQIFQGFVERLRLIREREQMEPGHAILPKIPSWNKTEAQKTLGIDVSKGSYIYTFYNDLGWFKDENRHLYDEYMTKTTNASTAEHAE